MGRDNSQAYKAPEIAVKRSGAQADDPQRKIKITGKKEGLLARDNYSFRKRQKEIAKKKKKEAKMQRKLDKKNIKSKEGEAQVS